MKKIVEQVRKIVGKKPPIFVGKNLVDASVNFVVIIDGEAAVVEFPLADGASYLLIPLPQEIDTSKVVDGITELK